MISVSTQNPISDCGPRVHVWDDLGCLLFMPADLMSTWKSKNFWSSIEVFFSFLLQHGSFVHLLIQTDVFFCVIFAHSKKITANV